MEISRIFNLNKSQAELDFIDIDIERDIPLFVDPFFLAKRSDGWSVAATMTIRNFFQKLIDYTRAGNENAARELFIHLHEPNSTCLGMSRAHPEGKGVGAEDTTKIYDNLLRSRAIQTGLLQDIEDNILFVENFGKDKLSDMTTNIIRKHLIQYTKDQCHLHNIPLTDGVPSEYYWCERDEEWKTEFTEMLVIDGKKLLLVPKGAVSFCKSYTPDKYYNHFVLNFLQNEHLRLGTALVQQSPKGRRYVTKKDLKEQNPPTKDFLRRFSLEHPEILAKFKADIDIVSIKILKYRK